MPRSAERIIAAHVACLIGITLIVLTSTKVARAGGIDRLFWARAFTNLCLQETYSNPRMMEALALSGRTATSFCSCGGDWMAGTIIKPEVDYFLEHKQLRSDTYGRWRRGLVNCVYANVR